MEDSVDRHLDGETAERYSMGRFSARRVRAVEEHLLICARCRKSVASSDAYLAAMRRAAATVRNADRKPKSKTTGRVRANG